MAALLLLLGLDLQSGRTPDHVASSTQPDVEAMYAHLPLAFEPNLGQAGDGVDFLVHHGQAVTAFSGTSSTTSVGGKPVTMSLVGSTDARFAGQGELPSKTNYFVGNDQSQWHSDIPNYKKLLAKNVYLGIDLAYYGTNSTLEHDFVVNPGSDYHQIAFSLAGQDSLAQDSDGNLVLKAGDETLQLNAPTTYQLGEHDKHTIPSRFELSGTTVTVALASDYDHAKPLVIDPTLVYSTYFGGTGADYGTRIALDPDSNVYVTGMATSAGFPTTAPYQASYGGGTFDAVVIKFNKDGSGPIYATYLGGSGDDRGAGIATDLAGNAYVSGLTDSTNFPTANAYQGTKGTGQDAFLTKLTPTGAALTYSTYFGGNANDYSQNLAVDSLGQVYLVGDTDSTNLPTVSAAYPTAPGNGDSFVTKFNAAGSALLYSTYLGGASSGEQTFGIAINNAGNAYLTGYTYSTNFPTVAAFQPTRGGGIYEAYVAELSTNGSSLVFSTYLGGSGDDQGSTVALDSAGNIYVTGQTDSSDFPTASPYQSSLAGSRDAFVAKFNPSASALTYSTYLGGSGSDTGSTIAVDSSNNAYVIGQTSSTDFPTANAYQGTKGVGFDAFVTALNSAGSALTYSTYFGGNGSDAGLGLALRLDGDVYLTGYTGSTDFPIVNAYQASNVGQDIFIAHLSDHTVNVTGVVPTGTINPTLSFSVSSPNCYLGVFSPASTSFCTHTMDASTNSPSGYVISYRYTTGLLGPLGEIDSLATPTASTTGTEQFGMNLAANTAAVSHTSTDFGADPSGGTGAAYSDYGTSNLFTFKPDNLPAVSTPLAYTPGASATTTYTASFIANVAPQTPSGYYAVGMIYIITASF